MGQPLHGGLHGDGERAGCGYADGNVTVSDGTDGVCGARWRRGSCSLTSTTAGAKTLTATYAGDANFNGSSRAPAAHQVDAANTTTTITSDAPDPGAPFSVTFSVTANSPGSGAPTGTVAGHRR